jgi:hypothetical protein
MTKNLLKTFNNSERFLRKSLLGVALLAVSVLTAKSQVETASGSLKLVQTRPLTPLVMPTSPLVVDPYAFYSNVTTDDNAKLSNGGAAVVSTLRTTKLVADHLNLGYTPPFNLTGFTFTIVNSNGVDITARPRVRFYMSDGTGGGPGTYIAGYSFTATVIPVGVNLFTGSITTPLALSVSDLWAALTFDNSGASPNPSLAQLNNLGQEIFNPIDLGTSENTYFVTSAASDGLVNNPVGSVLNGPISGKLANFGWELFNDVVLLPVTIEYITGARTRDTHVINWKVAATRTATVTMQIERSNNTQEFISVYSTVATEQRCQQPFSFKDEHPLAGVNYYRLKIKDADGKVSFSKIISVVNKEGEFQVGALSPNPVRDNARLDIFSIKSDKVDVIIHDLSGKTVQQFSTSLPEGNSQLPLNLSKLARGRYNVTIHTSTGTIKTVPVIKD